MSDDMHVKLTDFGTAKLLEGGFLTTYYWNKKEMKIDFVFSLM